MSHRGSRASENPRMEMQKFKLIFDAGKRFKTKQLEEAFCDRKVTVDFIKSKEHSLYSDTESNYGEVIDTILRKTFQDDRGLPVAEANGSRYKISPNRNNTAPHLHLPFRQEALLQYLEDVCQIPKAVIILIRSNILRLEARLAKHYLPENKDRYDRKKTLEQWLGKHPQSEDKEKWSKELKEITDWEGKEFKEAQNRIFDYERNALAALRNKNREFVYFSEKDQHATEWERNVKKLVKKYVVARLSAFLLAFASDSYGLEWGDCIPFLLWKAIENKGKKYDSSNNLLIKCSRDHLSSERWGTAKSLNEDVLEEDIPKALKKLNKLEGGRNGAGIIVLEDEFWPTYAQSKSGDRYLAMGNSLDQEEEKCQCQCKCNTWGVGEKEIEDISVALDYCPETDAW